MEHSRHGKLVVKRSTIGKDDLATLQADWQRLEKIANGSVFTSWYWISTWLKNIDYKAKLLTVTFNQEVVGLALVVERSENKYGNPIKQLWLNRTGDQVKDQIWNEYNDVLCAKGTEHAIRAAIINFFEQQTIAEELIIGASDETIQQTPISSNVLVHTSWATVSYSKALKPEYNELNQFLSELSVNSRQQIKRSIKLYGGLNSIHITPAQTADEAISLLTEAGELHKQRWKQRQSGFENPHFVSFHHQLIRDHFDNGCIDVLKIKNDQRVIAYLYNFKFKGNVYFYLSGIEYCDNNKLKPGLVAHSLAISYYANLGFKKYDFMGGEGRYKNSLSDEQSRMIISNFRRRNLPFMLSSILRKAKALYSHKNANSNASNNANAS